MQRSMRNEVWERIGLKEVLDRTLQNTGKETKGIHGSIQDTKGLLLQFFLGSSTKFFRVETCKRYETFVLFRPELHELVVRMPHMVLPRTLTRNPCQHILDFLALRELQVGLRNLLLAVVHRTRELAPTWSPGAPTFVFRKTEFGFGQTQF